MPVQVSDPPFSEVGVITPKVWPGLRHPTSAGPDCCIPLQGQGLWNRRGAAAVEFAAALPFTLTLMMGLFQVGTLFQTKQVLDEATREGVRQASQGYLATSAVQQVVLARLTESGVPIRNAVVQVADLDVQPSIDVIDASKGDRLQVEVIVPTNDVLPVMMTYLMISDTISSTTTWACVREPD
jgi:Flp pilus assembly protein TadG